jgi:hypothetical protein
MKKPNRKVLYTLTLLFSLALPHDSIARIPVTAFKDVTKHFKEDKKYLSPTLGRVAIESGLIYNLRFYGNFISGYDSNDKRLYIQDSSKVDPLWNLIYLLFPSPAGGLAVETAAIDNFGKYVADPAVVAQLLSLTESLRTNPSYLGTHEKDEFIQELLGKLNPDFVNNLDDYKEDEKYYSLLRWSKEFTSSTTKEKVDNLLTNTLDELSKPKEKKQTKKVKDLQNTLEFSLRNRKQDVSFNFSNATNILLQELDKDNDWLNTQLLQRKIRMIESTLQNLVEVIKASIEAEDRLHYPLYTTEQVILAFFSEKFNSQIDIWNLLINLQENKGVSVIKDSSDPKESNSGLKDLLENSNKEKFEGIKREKKHFSHFDEMIENSEKSTYLQPLDLRKMAEEQSYDMDTIYALLNADFFDSVTPYKMGESLLSNGLTQSYDRVKDKIIGGTFPDCVETLLRHLVNLLTFDPSAKQFNLNPIWEEMEKLGINGNHLQNNDPLSKLKEFFENKGRDQANAGGLEIRSGWNKVVGDLNNTPTYHFNNIPNHQKHKVIYKTGSTNEIKAGLINIMTVLQKVFWFVDLKLDDIVNPSTRRIAIQTALESLFRVFNPDRQCEVDIRLENMGNKESVGSINIKVSSKHEGDLFSFAMFAKEGHAEIREFKILKQGEGRDYTNQIRQYMTEGSHSVNNNTSEASIWLLVPPKDEKHNEGSILRRKKVKEKINPAYSNLWYNFFRQLIESNEQKYLVLDQLMKRDTSSKSMSETFPQFPIMDHLLENIIWEAGDNNEKIYSLINYLLEEKILSKFVNLRKVVIDLTANLPQEERRNTLELSTLLHLPPKTSELILKYMPEQFSSLPHQLKTFLLDKETPMPENLKSLTLAGNISEVILISPLMPILKKLTLLGNIKTVSLDNLNKLEWLDLEGMKDLQELSLVRLVALKWIKKPSTQEHEQSLGQPGVFDFSRTAIKKLNIKSCPTILELNLLPLYPLKELSLEKLKNLKVLNFDKSLNNKAHLDIPRTTSINSAHFGIQIMPTVSQEEVVLDLDTRVIQFLQPIDMDTSLSSLVPEIKGAFPESFGHTNSTPLNSKLTFMNKEITDGVSIIQVVKTSTHKFAVAIIKKPDSKDKKIRKNLETGEITVEE